MPSRPTPIIIPGPGGFGLNRKAEATKIDLGGILKLVNLLQEPGRQRAAQEAEATGLADVASALNPALQQTAQPIPIGEAPVGPQAELAAGTTLPGGIEGEQLPTPLLQSLTNLARQGKPEDLRKFIEGGAGVADPVTKTVLTSNVFSKIDPAKFSQPSIKAFQVTVKDGDPDFSLLELNTRELNNKIRGKSIPDAEGVLRKEFTKASSDFVKIRDSFARIQAAAQSPSPAGDLAFIFNYMKMLDPGSVVRESEFRTAQDAQAFMERKGFTTDALKRIWVGERLSDDARADFLNQSEAIFNGMDALQGKNETTFRRLATDQKLNPENVAIDLGLVEQEIGGGEQSELDALESELVEINKKLGGK